ncbi:hypothetical protein OAQ50_00515 [Acidimicrobiia bacterium]|nr:hypothetical protein [Acidimicrobiia bacterium]
MSSNIRKLTFFLTTFLLLLLPWFLQNSSEEIEPVLIDKKGTAFYQTNTCEFTLFDILSQNFLNDEINILPDTYSSVKCNSKINGVDYFESDIKVYIGTNANIDFLLQSLIWLLLIALIPKSNVRKFKYNNIIPIAITSILFTLHLLGEKNFYTSFAKSYSSNISFDNYFLTSLIAALIFILIIFDDLLKDRFYNLINYFPFMFLFIGAYNTFNLNFYLIILVYIGLRIFFETKVNVKLTLLYALLTVFWLVNNENIYLYFDVDKLKGFVSSSQSTYSQIFWIISFYFVVLALYTILNESKDFVNLKMIRYNFLLVGGLVSLFGILSAFYPFIRFLTYYNLGLNKLGMGNFTAIEGNTWRGISHSAEALGEYAAFTILFAVLISFHYKIKISNFEIVLIFLTLLNLFRSNNFAAVSSMVIFITLFFMNQLIKSKSFKITLIIFVIFSSLIIYSKTSEYSYKFVSSVLLNEAVNASIISDTLPGNEDGFTAADFSNFEIFLQESKEDSSLSSSLYYALDQYTNDGNIKYLPDSVAMVSQISVPINRSEKWGIFIAKYDPDFFEFIFGKGPLQLADYYLSHETKYNDGLVLPHSSLLDLLIFFGIFGVFSLLIYSTYLIYSNKKNAVYNYLFLFLLINYMKSDSILYLSSFILLYFTTYFYKFSFAIEGNLYNE